MIFRDFNNFYKESVSELEQLYKFEIQLEIIVYSYDEFFYTFVSDSLNGTYANVHNGYITSSTLQTKITSFMNEVINDFRNINLYEIGSIIYKIKDSINNNSLCYDCALLNNIIGKIDLINTKIFNFTSSNYEESKFDYLYKLITQIKELKLLLLKLKSNSDLLNYISNQTQNNMNLLDKDDFKKIELYYHDKDISFLNMSQLMITTSTLYDNLCNLCDVSTIDYKLLPARIESGSLFLELIGNEQILELMKMAIVAAGTYYFANHTKQGSTDMSIKKTKEVLDIVKMTKDLGFNIDSKAQQDVEGIVNQVCNNVNDLVCSTNLSVDGKNISEDAISQMLIESSHKRYLNSPSSHDNLI